MSKTPKEIAAGLSAQARTWLADPERLWDDEGSAVPQLLGLAFRRVGFESAGLTDLGREVAAEMQS